MPQNYETRLPDLITPFTEGIAQHLASPPLKQNQTRARSGTFLVVFVGYIAWQAETASRMTPSQIVAFALRLPDAPRETWLPVAVCAGLFAFGLLWAVVGIRGLRGTARDIMAAIWALFWGGLYAVCLWKEWYLPPEHYVVNFLLQAFYWAMVVSESVAFLLAVRGPRRGNAIKVVTRAIRNQAVTWRTGRQRQF